jgi:hypothetical protein
MLMLLGLSAGQDVTALARAACEDKACDAACSYEIASGVPAVSGVCKHQSSLPLQCDMNLAAGTQTCPVAAACEDVAATFSAGTSTHTCANFGPTAADCDASWANANDDGTTLACTKKICKASCNTCDFTTDKKCAISDYTSSCTPSPLRARGETCVYGFQCATSFCCPYLKICLTDSTDGIQSADVADEDAKAIIAADGQICPSASVDANSEACKCDEAGKPLIGKFDQSVCGCNAQYITKFTDETWIPGCTGGAGGSGDTDSGAVRVVLTLGLLLFSQ